MKRFVFALLLIASQGVFAAEGETRASVAAPQTYGAFISIGNPYPTLLGLNGAYNIDNNWRASVGYGEVEVTTGLSFGNEGFVQEKMKAQTYSTGIDYLFLQSGLRPIVGAKVGYFSVSGKGEFEIQGIKKSTALFYTNAGIDWVTKGGFNLGTGFNIALAGGKGANWYGNIGYFF